MEKITGKAAVIVGKYTNFDPANPQKTKAHEFTLIGHQNVKDGSLEKHWSKDGYILVGTANIEIELLPQKEMTTSAVASLRKQKASVLATAQMEATKIEAQIQSLLAITMD